MLPPLRFSRYRFTYTVQEPLKMPEKISNVFGGESDICRAISAASAGRGSQRQFVIDMNSISVRIASRILNSVLWVVTSFSFVTSAMGELSIEDLDKIDKIIQQSEKRMKEHMTQESEKLDIKIQSVDKLVDRNFYFLISLIALIVVAVGVPQILLTLRDKKYDNLVQEVERLKQQHIARGTG